MRTSVLPILTLQILAPLLQVWCAVGALRVARHTRNSARPLHLAWAVTGAVFLIMGSSYLIQGIAAAVAVWAGPGSDIYGAFLRWFPVGNQGRTGVMIGFALTLIWWSRSRGTEVPRRFVLVSGTLIFASLLCGGVVGWMEGDFTSERHYTAKATMDAISLVTLLAALSAMLLSNAVDRLLWLCLAIYAFYQAWNVIWFSAMAWFRIPGAWAPNPVFIQLYAIAAYAAMVALVSHRLRLARRGIEVPSLLQPLAGRPISTLG